MLMYLLLEMTENLDIKLLNLKHYTNYKGNVRLYNYQIIGK